MTSPRFLGALTILNLALPAILIPQVPSVAAGDAQGVLRGRSLEIVDDRGRVRASIKIHPAEPNARVPQDEAVVLRLIDPNGRPTIKIASSEKNSGQSIVGEADATHIILGAGGDSAITLSSRDGRKRKLEP